MAKKAKYLSQALADNSEAVIRGRGGNIIPPPEKESLWKAYLKKFKDPIIIVLLVVFALSLGVSLYEALFMGKGSEVLLEPIGVLVALLLATGVGFIFEVRAEKEFEVLLKVKDERPIKVFRRKDEGSAPRLRRIQRQDVVVGDVVRLESGDEVPADGVLLEASTLRVDESNFTGEMYANKTTDEEQFDPEATYPSNFLLRGSTIIEGVATYLVEAVGTQTEEGKGALSIQNAEQVQTPLNSQLERLSGNISTVSFVVALLILVGRTILFFTSDMFATGAYDWVSVVEYVLGSLMIAVTLIVVAVPEGLPMSVTVSLALSMRRMLRENNLVRKLHACETMGAATVICTDKTGTLTQNRMTVVESEIFGPREDVVANIAINSTAELSIDSEGGLQKIGNPTECAMLEWLHNLGIDYAALRESATILNQIPFSTDTKAMHTTFTLADSQEQIHFIKGAPEIVLDMSDRIAGGHSREEVEALLAGYQSKALRTLGFAVGRWSDGHEEIEFLGVVGIADPIREDVREAIDMCKNNAHVRVIIVTGDNSGTANEIGRQIGLLAPDEAPQMITGSEFAAMEHDEALRLVSDANFKILSRARPEDKARLVELLQEAGEVVAVTGDGTNDAPALNKAQVGLSMGDGTSRAKEASDITIIDNSFSSINKAIMWGRSLYLNIRRFIVFQMTINICACLIVLLGAFMGMDSPLTVTQMLWVNLVMDTFAAMALSSLPADKKVLYDKPRHPKSHIIDRAMLVQILSCGVLFFVMLVGLWQLLWHTNVESVAELISADNLRLFFSGMFDGSHIKAHLDGKEMAIFFSVFVVMQFWNLFNAKYMRSGRSLLMDVRDLFVCPQRVRESYSKGFVLIAIAILGGQVLIVNFAGSLFSVAPLELQDWLRILLITSPVLLVGEIVRGLRLCRRHHQPSHH